MLSQRVIKTLSRSSVSGGIRHALATVQSAAIKAMIGAMKCMYWLCKQVIAHTTKFSDLLGSCKEYWVNLSQ